MQISKTMNFSISSPENHALNNSSAFNAWFNLYGKSAEISDICFFSSLTLSDEIDSLILEKDTFVLLLESILSLRVIV